MNCFKKCIFAVIQTTECTYHRRLISCELLQKVYLCSNTNNLPVLAAANRVVVNCFKKCIFAVIQTTDITKCRRRHSCELLQKVYLCSNTNNPNITQSVQLFVVNCFKKCIFAVIQTTLRQMQNKDYKL